MTRVSKKEVSAKTLAQIKAHLVSIFFAQDSKGDFEGVMRELFTRAEYVMLAKRVGAIGLLDAGYSTYQISELLHMSPTTLGKLQHAIENGKFKYMRTALKKKKGRELFIKTLEVLVTPRGASRRLREIMRNDIEKWKAGK